MFKRIVALAAVAAAAAYYLAKRSEEAEDAVIEGEEPLKKDELLEKLNEVNQELSDLVNEAEKEETAEVKAEETVVLEAVVEENKPTFEEINAMLNDIEEKVMDNEEPQELTKEEFVGDFQERNNRKLLDLQVDLVMANYPDSRVFVLQHQLVAGEGFESLEQILKDRKYIVTSDAKGYNAHKVVINKDNAVKEEVLFVADQANGYGCTYKGFNVIPQ